MPFAVPGRRTRAESADALSPTERFVQSLYSQSLLEVDDLLHLPESVRRQFDASVTTDEVLSLLVDWRLLTPYQAYRIQAGATFGLVLGNYRVLDRLGSGSMGVVFRGEDRFLRSPVALKVFPFHGGHNRAPLDRFLRESKILRQLRNPHIVSTLDAGVTFPCDANGTSLYYFAMEFIQGCDLHRLIATQGPAPVPRVCRWMMQLAIALADAHQQGLVHRDIKPANLIVGTDGQLKLLDFGIARHPGLGEVGHWGGTVEFMAPEQIQSVENLDHRADLYGLGAVMFWCLTGRLPYPPTGNLISDFQRRLEHTPSVRDHCPSVDAEVEGIVRRLMSLYPQDRYARAEDVLAALSALV
jgi:serine/threonine protein kinase